MYIFSIFYTLNMNLKLLDLDGYLSPTNVCIYVYISIKHHKMYTFKQVSFINSLICGRIYCINFSIKFGNFYLTCFKNKKV